VLPIHPREQALAYRCAAEPGISPSRGKEQRTKGDGMNTGFVESCVSSRASRKRSFAADHP
jgi:hypothetical protein